MIIEKQKIGAYSHRTIYAVCSDATENGDGRPHEIARFDTLEQATIVLRYMRGDSLSESDEYRAKEALKKTDVSTLTK